MLDIITHHSTNEVYSWTETAHLQPQKHAKSINTVCQTNSLQKKQF